MIRKIFSITILMAMCSILFLPLRSMAAESGAAADGGQTAGGTLQVTDILPPQQSFIGRERGPDAGRGAKLPEGSLTEELVPAMLTIVLSVAGSIAFITFVVTGIMMIVAHGNEELYTKAKTIFLYALGGLVIIALSYAIIYGIFTLRFGGVIGEG